MQNARRRFTVVLGLVLSAGLAGGAHVDAEPVIDQQQPIINVSIGGLGIGNVSQQKLAQVVTQGVTGLVTEVRLPVSCGAGSDLVVEVQGVEADRPNGVVLTSQTIPGATLPGAVPPTLRSLVFSTPVALSAGDRFAIVLSSSGACGIFAGPAGDSYPGGNFYFDSRPNQAGVWVCNCEFPGAPFDLPFQTVVGAAPSVLTVLIDIKPGSDRNRINLKSAGAIPVAILSSAMFDARTIDPDSVSLAGARVKVVGKSERFLCREKDVNGDGFVDLVCKILTAEFMIEPGESVAVLEARTTDGQSVRGQDVVRIVPH